MSTEIPVALVDASNFLYNLGTPLSKVQAPVPQMPALSRVPGRAGAYGDVTRAHRSVGISDGGEKFAMDRMAAEVYPIQGPLCDMRGTYQVFGQPSRYDGRSQYVYDR